MPPDLRDVTFQEVLNLLRAKFAQGYATEQQIRPLKLSMSDNAVLKALIKLGPSKADSIAHYLKITTNSASSTLQLLSRKGYTKKLMTGDKTTGHSVYDMHPDVKVLLDG